MLKKNVSGVMLTMLLVGTLTLSIGMRVFTAESTPSIYILVDSSIYSAIEFYIDRYISDVGRLGFNVSVLSISGSSPEDIRAILVNASSEGLVGCLLVGDVPWALYEMDHPDDPEFGYEEFPIDLFYMDLNGIWTDSDSDGKYDQHSGDRAPEIWVGRIKASGMVGNEVSLIQNYFDKNHGYRTGALSLPNRALVYIDDDWTREWSEWVNYSVSLVYNDRTLVNENVTTNPQDYLNRLKQNWSLVHLMVHGEPDLHYFMTNGVWVGNVTSSDIRSTDPHAFFYILYSCSNARYSEYDYISGSYVLSDTYGVAAIGSTKTGGMLWSDDFYRNFKMKTLGFSFREWLVKRVIEEDADPTWWYDKRWYYGMTIIGDPTLSAKPEVSNVAITSIKPYRAILSNSTLTSINITTMNRDVTTETFNITLYCNTSEIRTETVTLSVGQSTELIFGWNTTSIPLGNYTLSAQTSPIPGETETEDNTLTYSSIQISIAGDVNGDGTVNIIDIANVAKAYGKKLGNPEWNGNFDVNEDGAINILDIATVAKDYGKTV